MAASTGSHRFAIGLLSRSFSLSRTNVLNINANSSIPICHKHTGKPQKQKGSAEGSNIPFDGFIEMRKLQAKRSLLIQVPDRPLCDTLYKYCSGFGNIRHMVHFSNKKDYVLMEYEHARSVTAVLENSGHFMNNEKIPAETRVLHTTENSFPKSFRRHSSPQAIKILSEVVPEFNASHLSSDKSISEQVLHVYNALKLTDLDVRMKFFVCTVIEDALSSLFPKCQVSPFGSSVNGFGKHGCDLDMVLDLAPDTGAKRDAKLRFMTKKRNTDERVFTQQSLRILGDLLQYFVPHCVQVQRIPRARVPILKFMHEASNIECDLCMTNRTGVPMSELLYLFGEYDNRVRPLVFTIRLWARMNELTNKSPGPWITNFTLAMLVTFFLQTKSPTVLPSVETISSCTDFKERRIIDGIDCSFVKEVAKLAPSQNNQNLGELLLEFFEFCASFDFTSNAISIVEGRVYPKPDFSPMYIRNPLEPDLNVSKNITLSEVERLQKLSKDAVWKLTVEDTNSRLWGLMKILQQPKEKKLGVKASDLLSLRTEDIAAEAGS